MKKLSHNQKKKKNRQPIDPTWVWSLRPRGHSSTLKVSKDERKYRRIKGVFTHQVPSQFLNLSQIYDYTPWSGVDGGTKGS